jgi:hypothetical protein
MFVPVTRSIREPGYRVVAVAVIQQLGTKSSSSKNEACFGRLNMIQTHQVSQEAVK